MQKKLAEYYHVIPLVPDETLDSPLQCHPDMLCAHLDDTLFFPRGYAEAHPKLIEEIVGRTGLKAVLTDCARSSRYPEDVALNAAVLPDALLCRRSSAAPELLRMAEMSGRRILHVRQGYAACSCILSGTSVLTSDKGIYAALTQSGSDCTYVPNDGIRLPGYDIGLIGGCGGADSGILWLFGSPDTLPCGTVIRRFADHCALTVYPLGEDVLTDYGGLKFLHPLRRSKL